VFLTQPPRQGAVWAGTVWEDVASSKEGTGRFFLTIIPLCACEVRTFNCVKRRRTRRESGNKGKQRQTHLLPSKLVAFFFLFLKIQCTKVGKIKLMVPPTGITLLLAEKEQDINTTSYPAVHATYVRGGKLWVLREPSL